MAAVSPQSLPTTSVDGRPIAVQVARQMLAMVGAGWQAPNGSNNAADALALGSSIADLRTMLLGVWDQIFVSSATSTNGLLTEWEELLGLPTDGTLPDAERQARLLAFTRAAFAGTPQGIESAVAALTGTGTCTVVEYTAADVVLTDPTPDADSYRGVFRFTVVVPRAWVVNTTKRALVQSVVERMKPAHTTFVVSDGTPLQFDEPSGFDMTALGA